MVYRDSRRFSNGCIRVEKPHELAALLMQQPTDAINQAIATGSTIRRDLHPVSEPADHVGEQLLVEIDVLNQEN